ncbi:MAG: apolipoprotein N-acyltransferase, partial [Thiomonas sp.]
GAAWLFALPFAFAFACAWTAPEIVRGTAMTGLPLLSLGYEMVGTAFFGYAPIVGLYGVGFAAAFASALLGALVFARSWRVAAILALVLMVDLAGGELAGSVRWTHPAGEPIRVAAIQDGIGMSAKYSNVGQTDAIQRYTAWAGAFKDTLIVGSETAIPMPMNRAPRQLLRALRLRLAAHGNVALLGAKMPLPGRSAVWTNSVIAFGSPAPYRYDKRHLIPFGEYTPRGMLAQWLGSWVGMTGASSLRPGSTTQANFDDRGAGVIPTICFENLFPGLVVSSLHDNRKPHVPDAPKTQKFMHLRLFSRLRRRSEGVKW